MTIGHDVEVYKNYFCVGIENYIDNTKILFEISEERNDYEKFMDFYTSFKGHIVSFNGIYYDNLIINYLIKNYIDLKDKPWYQITTDLKYFSDLVINSDDHSSFKDIKYFKKPWEDIDLFLYWSKETRLVRKISLKSLGIQLGYNVVQELPFHPSSILEIEDLPKIRTYNMTHDLGILRLLYDNMEGEVNLRKYIQETLKIDCLSMDAPKIASEILLLDYCQQTKYFLNNVRKWRYERNSIPIKNVLVGFDPHFELPIFKNLFEEINNSYDHFSKELLFNYKNTNIILKYGVGGLHSVNDNEKYESNDTHIIMTSDVASLYPNLIINYKCVRFLEVLLKYANVKAERLIAKKNKEKQKDTLFKLILNSISGLLDMQHSWLYFPEGALRMRLLGQLILTKFIETCAIQGWQVVSANTDGIEVIIPKEDREKYIAVLDETTKLFNLELEHNQYDFIYYANVNNYIAKMDNGEIKTIGMFKEKPVLGNSVDMLVVPKALKAFYVNNIDFSEFISNPDKYNLHIYDYCKSNKISKDYTVYHNNEKQQQLNRYYFQKGAPFLFKKKPNKNLEHVNVGQGVRLFNTYEDIPFEDYKINYSFYIKKCRDIVDTLNRFNQLTLF